MVFFMNEQLNRVCYMSIKFFCNFRIVCKLRIRKTGKKRKNLRKVNCLTLTDESIFGKIWIKNSASNGDVEFFHQVNIPRRIFSFFSLWHSGKDFHCNHSILAMWNFSSGNFFTTNRFSIQWKSYWKHW